MGAGTNSQLRQTNPCNLYTDQGTRQELAFGELDQISGKLFR